MLPCRGRGTGSTPVGTAFRSRGPAATTPASHAGNHGSSPCGITARAARPIGKTPASHVGNRGSTPRRSTATRAHGPMGRRQYGILAIRVRLPVGPLIRKVAGYGWPGHGANVVLLRGDKGSTPLPSARAPVVKRRSCLASNEALRVRLLLGVLDRPVVQRPGQPLDMGKTGGSSPPGTTFGRATRLATGTARKAVEP